MYFRKLLILILFGLAVYFPLFLHLDMRPLATWDESLFAYRALYMAETGKYMHSFGLYDYFVDFPSTKPPGFTWIQAMSFRILGFNEMALRLPVALSVLAMVLAMPWFSRKITGSWWPGLLAGLVIVSSTGFIQPHLTRSGDHDAPLAVFMFFGALFFYQYLESKNRWWLALLALLLTAAFLTKYLVGFLFIPGFLLYAWYRGKLPVLIKDPYLYLAIGASLLILAILFIPLELNHPGFLARVWDHELFGRYTETIDNHSYPFFYYVSYWLKGKLQPWIMLIPVCAVLIFHPAYQKYRDLSVFLLACFLPYLLIMSFSQTKAMWYMAPLYPPAAMLAGLILHFFWKKLAFAQWRPLFAGLLLIAVFYYPYQRVIEQVYTPKNTARTDHYGSLMKKLERDHPDITAYYILTHRSLCFHAGIYKEFYERKGYELRIVRKQHFREGDQVLVCLKENREALLEEYETEVLERKANCLFVEIKGKKKD